MADEDDIVQRIRFEGEEEASNVFRRLATVGSKAFSDIRFAVQNVERNFKTVRTVAKVTYDSIEKGSRLAAANQARLEKASYNLGLSIANVGTVVQRSFTNIANAVGAQKVVSSFQPIINGVSNVVAAFIVGTARINTSLRDFYANLRNIGAFRAFRVNLKDVENASRQLGNAIGEVAVGLGTFVRRLALIAGAATVIATLRSIAASVRSVAAAQRNASREAVANIRDEKTDRTALARVYIQQREAQQDLNRDYALGKISAEQYTTALQDLQRQTERNVRAQLAQDAADDANRRQQFQQMKKLREAEEFQRIADVVGTQAAGAFIRLGSTIDVVLTNLKNTLGPVLADIINGINAAVQKAMPQITALFEDIKKEFAPIAANFAQSFQQALPEIINFVRGVVQGVKVVAGAVTGLIAILDQVAKTINDIFGTQLSGAGLAGVAVVLSLTGGFSALLPILKVVSFLVLTIARAFGGWSIVVTIVRTLIGSFVVLAGSLGGIPLIITAVVAGIVAWLAATGRLQKAWAAVSSTFSTIMAVIRGFLRNGIQGAIEEYNKLPKAAEQSAQQSGAAFQNTGKTIAQQINEAAAKSKSSFGEIPNAARTSAGLTSAEFDKLKAQIETSTQEAGRGAGRGLDEISAAARRNVTSANTELSKLGTSVASVGPQLQTTSQQFGVAFGNIVLNARNAAGQIRASWTEVVEFMKALPAQFTDIGGMWDQVAQGARSSAGEVTSAFNGMVGPVTSAFDQIAQAAVDAWNRIPSGLKDILSAGGGIGGKAEGGAIGLARGGGVRGPGTSTSDSIPAWLSNGEFVHRAKAVRHYGLRFMNMINRLQFPKDALGFAHGGLAHLGSSLAPAPQPILKLAEGGGVSTPRNVLNLSMDGQTFPGMLVPDDTFGKLKKQAVKKSLSPRTPNWYR